MTVMPFISPKDRRLLKAIDELAACALIQARIWEEIRIAPDMSVEAIYEARQLNVIAAVSLLHATGDSLQKRFIAEETAQGRLVPDPG